MSERATLAMLLAIIAPLANSKHFYCAKALYLAFPCSIHNAFRLLNILVTMPSLSSQTPFEDSR
jgi:hypothetical protein